jgi:hypothetical protein
MAQKHTPAPWTVYKRYSGGLDIHSDDSVVAIALNGSDNHLPVRANARLIAAAPNLLTALRDALESLRRLPDTEGAYRVSCIAQAEAAIKKAEGNCA